LVEGRQQSSMVYKAIIFDLDGTLLDTLQDIANSANRVLRSLGFPQHDVQTYKHFVGDGIDVLAYRMLPPGHRDATTVAQAVAYLDKEYKQHWKDTTRPYEGIPELLEALVARQIKMAILSNKSDSLTKLMVSTLLPHWRFESGSGSATWPSEKAQPHSSTKHSSMPEDTASRVCLSRRYRYRHENGKSSWYVPRWRTMGFPYS